MKNLENFIKTCIHSLDGESHNENSVSNIYTGEIAAADVNVNKAFKNGQSKLKNFKESLPEGIRSTIKKTCCTYWIQNQAKEQSCN